MEPANQPYEVTDRRPMGFRDMAAFKAVTRWLASANVSPNAISVSSVVFSSMAGASFVATALVSPGPGQRLLWLAGGLLVQLRGIANLLDGMVAVEAHVASATGELFNEVPDRISDALMLIGFGYAFGSSPVLGFAAAAVAIFVAYIRAQGKVSGAAQHYVGPMAKMQRNTVVTLAAWWIAVTPIAWNFGWWGADTTRGLPDAVLWLIIVAGLWTAIRRLRLIAADLRGGGT